MCIDKLTVSGVSSHEAVLALYGIAAAKTRAKGSKGNDLRAAVAAAAAPGKGSCKLINFKHNWLFAFPWYSELIRNVFAVVAVCLID